jgi:2-keto-4-pentenoate hydratase/2-oxohepta-3-ene-1,7-dioic acid hydratase in catechol pathway
VGVKTDDGIVDITALGFPARMNDVIEGGDEMIARIKTALQTGTHAALSEESVKFLPVTEPKKIICEGLNYKAHAEEGGAEVPKHPIFFSKFSDSLSAHGQPVKLPPWLSRYDYEAELVIVIGKHAYNVTEEEAEACIFGYTCGNDLSARDSQFLSSQWLSGKALPGFGPVGPYIVTRDCLDPREPVGIHCDLNGERVQSAKTSDMIFPCFEAVSTASKFFPLSPGDIIFTGTPEGVILGRKKEDRIWLKPGDIVNVTIDGIGTLTTPLEFL